MQLEFKFALGDVCYMKGLVPQMRRHSTPASDE